MTPRLIALTTILGFAASTAIAEDGNFSAIDTDASGTLSLSEIQTAAPSVTAAEFAAYDADGSGDLSMDEFTAWKTDKQSR